MMTYIEYLTKAFRKDCLKNNYNVNGIAKVSLWHPVNKVNLATILILYYVFYPPFVLVQQQSYH